MSQVRGMAGDREGARRVVEAQLPDPQAGGLASLAHVFAAALSGDEAKVRRILAPEFERLIWDDLQYCHMVAQSCSLLGRNEEALRWLGRAVERRFIHGRFLGGVDPLLVPLRGDERFQGILERARKAAEAFPGEAA